MPKGLLESFESLPNRTEGGYRKEDRKTFKDLSANAWDKPWC